MTTKDLSSNEYGSYYSTYISKATGLTLNEGLASNYKKIELFLKSIPENKLEYRYAEGKWTIKEMMQHIIDTERIFAYRALRVARQDKTPLPGYEQDDYVLPSKANLKSLEQLLEDYKAVRQSTITLFKGLGDNMLKEIGTASNSPVSPRAIGFIIIGHENHHCEVIKERYL